MSQSLSVYQLAAVPLAPLVGAVLAGVLGTQFGGNHLGRKASHTLTILGVLVAFVLSVHTLVSVVQDGARYNETLYTWMVVGGLKMEIGFLVDGLTAMMMCVVTFVSLMVHIYTIGYMEEDEGYNRFFAYISLFTFSMLMLVMSNNLLQLFFGWEAVGLVSYLLIGSWSTGWVTLASFSASVSSSRTPARSTTPKCLRSRRNSPPWYFPVRSGC